MADKLTANKQGFVTKTRYYREDIDSPERTYIKLIEMPAVAIGDTRQQVLASLHGFVNKNSMDEGNPFPAPPESYLLTASNRAGFENGIEIVRETNSRISDTGFYIYNNPQTGNFELWGGGASHMAGTSIDFLLETADMVHTKDVKYGQSGSLTVQPVAGIPTGGNWQLTKIECTAPGLTTSYIAYQSTNVSNVIYFIELSNTAPYIILHPFNMPNADTGASPGIVQIYDASPAADRFFVCDAATVYTVLKPSANNPYQPFNNIYYANYNLPPNGELLKGVYRAENLDIAWTDLAVYQLKGDSFIKLNDIAGTSEVTISAGNLFIRANSKLYSINMRDLFATPQQVILESNPGMQVNQIVNNKYDTLTVLTNTGMYVLNNPLDAKTKGTPTFDKRLVGNFTGSIEATHFNSRIAYGPNGISWQALDGSQFNVKYANSYPDTGKAGQPFTVPIINAVVSDSGDTIRFISGNNTGIYRLTRQSMAIEAHNPSAGQFTTAEYSDLQTILAGPATLYYGYLEGRELPKDWGWLELNVRSVETPIASETSTGGLREASSVRANQYFCGKGTTADMLSYPSPFVDGLWWNYDTITEWVYTEGQWQNSYNPIGTNSQYVANTGKININPLTGEGSVIGLSSAGEEYPSAILTVATISYEAYEKRLADNQLADSFYKRSGFIPKIKKEAAPTAYVGAGSIGISDNYIYLPSALSADMRAVRYNKNTKKSESYVIPFTASSLAHGGGYYDSINYLSFNEHPTWSFMASSAGNILAINKATDQLVNIAPNTTFTSKNAIFYALKSYSSGIFAEAGVSMMTNDGRYIWIAPTTNYINSIGCIDCTGSTPVLRSSPANVSYLYLQFARVINTLDGPCLAIPYSSSSSSAVALPTMRVFKPDGTYTDKTINNPLMANNGGYVCWTSPNQDTYFYIGVMDSISSTTRGVGALNGSSGITRTLDTKWTTALAGTSSMYVSDPLIIGSNAYVLVEKSTDHTGYTMLEIPLDGVTDLTRYDTSIPSPGSIYVTPRVLYSADKQKLVIIAPVTTATATTPLHVYIFDPTNKSTTSVTTDFNVHSPNNLFYATQYSQQFYDLCQMGSDSLWLTAYNSNEVVRVNMTTGDITRTDITSYKPNTYTSPGLAVTDKLVFVDPFIVINQSNNAVYALVKSDPTLYNTTSTTLCNRRHRFTHENSMPLVMASSLFPYTTFADISYSSDVTLVVNNKELQVWR